MVPFKGMIILIVRLKSQKEELEGYGVIDPYNFNKMLDQNSLIFKVNCSFLSAQ